MTDKIASFKKPVLSVHPDSDLLKINFGRDVKVQASIAVKRGTFLILDQEALPLATVIRGEL